LQARKLRELMSGRRAGAGACSCKAVVEGVTRMWEQRSGTGNAYAEEYLWKLLLCRDMEIVRDSALACGLRH
jgi:hypothetical protein